MAESLFLFFHIFLVILFVLLNGFFVASEFSMVKVRSTRINQLSKEGNIKAKKVQKILQNIDLYLSATQLGITLSSLALGWLGEPFFAKIITNFFKAIKIFSNDKTLIEIISLTLAFIIITFLQVIIGEITPKSLAIRKAEETTLFVATPLYIFSLIFKPTIWLLNTVANSILKVLKINPVYDFLQAHTEEEIKMLVEHSQKSGIIDKKNSELFENIFDFTSLIAKEVMVPRVNIVCIYLEQSFQKKLEVIQQSNFTRFPLCKKDKDNIMGIIHIRDVYEKIINKQTNFSFEDIARPLVLVPETMEIKDILQTLQKNKTEMAIVIDEYGGTAGIITIEDIVEEIVGEIQDEFDNEQPNIYKEGKNIYVNSRVLISELNDYLNINIDNKDNNTIGGWVFSQLQKIPRKGATITFEKYKFIVDQVQNKRISRILIKPKKNIK